MLGFCPSHVISLIILLMRWLSNSDVHMKVGLSVESIIAYWPFWVVVSNKRPVTISFTVSKLDKTHCDTAGLLVQGDSGQTNSEGWQ